MIIAVDFDGTLAETDYPNIIAPKQTVIDYCIRHQMAGDVITLNTCRHGKPLEDAIEWCAKQGLIFDYINENIPERIAIWGECRKIYADVYIDDHNKLISELD